MSAFMLSTITLFMELFIALLIFWVIYAAYVGVYLKNVAIFAIVYETFFNIAYMVYRSVHPTQTLLSQQIKTVGMVHGILSLVMYFFLIIVFVRASRASKKGINFFERHGFVTLLFIVGWLVSIATGVWLYWAVYLLR